MNEHDEWRPFIRALIYPAQFAVEPVQSVDRVLEQVVGRGALGASPERYLSSVRAALASDSQLADLIPQEHSEAEIRRFLSAIAERLADADGV